VVAANWGRNVFDCISKFVQFQLTVNIAALTLSVIGAFWVQKSPVSAVQMLWVNLIMDSLGSLALATEPPNDAQMDRTPVNRSASLITQRMWYNMLGHAIYQVCVVGIVMFYGHVLFPLPGCLDKDESDLAAKVMTYYEDYGEYTVQGTIVFHVFVLMQFVNEINMRKVYGESNAFEGLWPASWPLGNKNSKGNPYFISIVVVTTVLQCLMVLVGGAVFNCTSESIGVGGWLFSLGFALGEIPWQWVINFVAAHTLHITQSSGAGGGIMKYGSGNITLPVHARFGSMIGDDAVKKSTSRNATATTVVRVVPSNKYQRVQE